LVKASEKSGIETRTVASVVGAMSHALETSIARLIASMDQQVPRR
jgi:predicted metallo-beta-lactamase superfamily hydrolase